MSKNTVFPIKRKKLPDFETSKYFDIVTFTKSDGILDKAMASHK